MAFPDSEEHAGFIAAYLLCMMIAGKTDGMQTVILKGVTNYDERLSAQADDIVAAMTEEEKASAYILQSAIEQDITVAISKRIEYNDMGIESPKGNSKEEINRANKNTRDLITLATEPATRAGVNLQRPQ